MVDSGRRYVTGARCTATSAADIGSCAPSIRQRQRQPPPAATACATYSLTTEGNVKLARDLLGWLEDRLADSGLRKDEREALDRALRVLRDPAPSRSFAGQLFSGKLERPEDAFPILAVAGPVAARSLPEARRVQPPSLALRARFVAFMRATGAASLPWSRTARSTCWLSSGSRGRSWGWRSRASSRAGRRRERETLLSETVLRLEVSVELRDLRVGQRALHGNDLGEVADHRARIGEAEGGPKADRSTGLRHVKNRHRLLRFRVAVDPEFQVDPPTRAAEATEAVVVQTFGRASSEALSAPRVEGELCIAGVDSVTGQRNSCDAVVVCLPPKPRERVYAAQHRNVRVARDDEDRKVAHSELEARCVSEHDACAPGTREGDRVVAIEGVRGARGRDTGLVGEGCNRARTTEPRSRFRARTGSGRVGRGSDQGESLRPRTATLGRLVAVGAGPRARLARGTAEGNTRGVAIQSLADALRSA